MKNELKVFRNEDFGEVKVLTQDEIVLFNLSDLGFALGYTKQNSTGKKYLQKDRIANIAETIEITGVYATYTKIEITKDIDFENTYITEQDFYDLCLESKAKHARKFRKWITNEVLPTIRKTGGYVNTGNEEDFIKNYFPSFSDEVKQAMVLDLRKQNEEYKRQLEEQKQKVDFADSINFSKASITMKEFADLLNIKKFGRNTMMEWLRKKDFINKKNEPYRQYIDMGIFETKEKPIDIGNGKTKMQITTYITGKGQTYLYEKISKDIAV